MRVDDGSPSDIAGQTGSTYSLTSSDVSEQHPATGHLHRRPRLLGVTDQRSDRPGNRLEFHPQTTLAGHHRSQRGRPGRRLYLQCLYRRLQPKPRRIHRGPKLRPDHHLPGRIAGQRNQVCHRPQLPAQRPTRPPPGVLQILGRRAGLPKRCVQQRRQAAHRHTATSGT